MTVTQAQNPGTAPAPGPATPEPNPQTVPGTAPGPGPAGRVPAGHAPADGRTGLAAALRPLAIDVGVPLGSYYLLRDALGVSLWLSLALSGIGSNA